MIVAALLAATVASGGVAMSQTNQPSNPSVRGTVFDGRTNAPIADASVTLVEAGNRTTRTGADGRFEFTNVPPRTYTLTVSTIGYIFVRRRVEAPSNTTVDVRVPLAEGTGTYQETVTVAADTTRPKAVGVSSQVELGSAGLAELRGVAADDPMRAIQALPGVATGDDFQAEFSVRGSAFRHVGVVLDGTPTQLLVHTVRSSNDAGSIAMINSDILGRAALFGGPHARPHGDWIGATLEFDAREGSRDRAGFRLAASGTSASGVFEGPLGRGRRGSWLVSLRKSYIDWLIRKLEPDVDSTIGFSDAQAKFVYDVTPRQQVQLFTVFGDAKYHEQQTGLANGLQNAHSRSVLSSLSWRYAHPRAILTKRVSFVQGRHENRGMVGQLLASGLSSSVALRSDLLVLLGPGLTVEGGTRVEWIDAGETLRNYSVSGVQAVRLRAERISSADPVTAGVWGQLTWRGQKAAMTVGVRAVEQIGTQAAASPWLLGEIALGKTTLRAGVGRAAQFVDPIIAAQTPGGLAPERATAYDLGLERPIWRDVRAQVTGFHRDDDHVLRRTGEVRLNPATGQPIAATTFPEFSNALAGASRGVDVLLVRRAATGPSGWIGYTWSHTRYRDHVTGEVFDGDFDQRHTLNVFVQQRLSYRLALSGKLRLGSNFPIVGYFTGTPESLRLGALRNLVRLPQYARLDVRVNRTFTFQRSRLTLFAEVMNLLDRENGGQSDGFVNPVTLAANSFVERLLPRIPSAGLLFEF